MLKPQSLHRIWLGRAHEMAEIERGLHDLVQGRGSLFVITGEPGIGKTRLADEAARLAIAAGVSVHWGRAWEAGGAPPYWPFLQALRSISPDAPAVRALATPSETPVERFELFEAVDALLRTAAPPPRAIVLDDLHAADPPSLELLHFVARDLRSRPLLLIATYRDAEARLAPELGPLLARIGREACGLPLGPLDRADVRAYLAQATGSQPAGDRVEQIYLKTEGNPLFLRELLQLHGARAEPSDGIRAVVRARLALLPAACREALEAAAVLGREFAAAPLAAVAGVSELEVRALVEPASYAGIVETLQAPPRWRFTHVLLRQGLYDDLSAERRTALHRAAATALRGPVGAPLAEVAHHLRQAIPAVSPGEAAHAALAAARHAIGVLGFEDALRLYDDAEALLEGLGEEPARFEATLGAGLALMRMAEVERGRAACRRAAELARRMGDGERFARAILTGGYEHVPAVRDPVRIAELEEALARLPPGDSALRARCLAQLAGDRAPEPDMGPLVSLARDAVEVARRAADEDALRDTLSAASFAVAVHAEPAERIALYQETLRLALSAGDKRVALRVHGFLMGTFWELGDPQGARPHQIAVDALVNEFRHGRFHWLASFGHALAALATGRFEEGERRLDEARASLELDEARGTVLAGSPIAVACLRERYDDAAQLESQTRAALGGTGHPLGGLLGELLVAQLHGRSCDRRRAAAQLAACAAHPLFDRIAEPAWLAMLTDACYVTGDRALAERLDRALSSHAARFAFLGPLTAAVDLPYSRHLGLLAEIRGRIDDAIAHLEDAAARTARAGMRAQLARIQHELARAWLGRGGPGDRERAAALLAEARTLAVELGQAGLLPRIAALLPEPTGLRPPTAGAAAPRFTLRREGAVWSIESAGRVARLRDSRGLALLARLVDSPGLELHVLQLVSSGDGRRDAGDAGPLLDDRAVHGYRGRLLELRDELAEAEAFADAARADRARTEIEMLTRELARAVGLGGRARRAGDAAERARTAAQKRLREAIRRIADELPELGRHLDQTVRTGLFCGYFPDGRPR
jgi:hypothetical protein